MIEVTIDSVRVNLMSPHRLVILREVGADRFSQSGLDLTKPRQLQWLCRKWKQSRPLNSRSPQKCFHCFQCQDQTDRDRFTQAGYFLRRHHRRTGRQGNKVDSRPSDAIALAVRAHVPIMVDEDVMKTAEIKPEDDMESSGAAPAQGSGPTRAAPVGEVSSDRLSVFEDFLGKLDLDKLDDKNKDKDKPEDDDKDKPKKQKHDRLSAARRNRPHCSKSFGSPAQPRSRRSRRRGGSY